MILSLIVLLIFLILSIVIFKFKEITAKVLLISLLVFTGIFSVVTMVNKPKMHKLFSISVIDYLIKFNDDGSITTTKQTTTTELKHEGEGK